MNSEYYRINDEKYEKYFDEKFTDKANNFIKNIQNEVTNTLNNKNKNISTHILLFLLLISIYSVFIIYQIKDIFIIVKEVENEDKNFKKLFAYILIISLFLIQLVNYFFVNYSIFDRLVIGVFATPFCLVICNILIKSNYSSEISFKLNKFLFR